MPHERVAHPLPPAAAAKLDHGGEVVTDVKYALHFREFDVKVQVTAVSPASAGYSGNEH